MPDQNTAGSAGSSIAITDGVDTADIIDAGTNSGLAIVFLDSNGDPAYTIPISHAALTELAAAINASSQVDVNLAASGVTVTIAGAVSAGIANTNHTAVSGLGLVDGSGTPRPLAVGMYNGSNYDSIRGDTTNGVDVDVTRSALPSGASTLAEQQSQTTALQIMDDWDNGASDGASVSGDVAHDTADAGEPVKIGFRAFSPDGTAPGTAVAENDRVNGKADLDGRQYVSTVHPEMWSYHDDDAAAVTTDGTLHADPGDGFAVFITDIVWSIGAATASTLFIEEGSTKILGPYNLPATIGAGMALHFTTPKKCTASTAILITNTGSINFCIDVMGYVAAV